MNTVLHLSSGNHDDQDHALANASNLLADETLDLDHVVLVANGEGVRLLADGSHAADDVAALIDDGVSLRACSNSIARRDISPDDLLPGVETASSGVGECTRLQSEGYAYVKVP